MNSANFYLVYMKLDSANNTYVIWILAWQTRKLHQQ